MAKNNNKNILSISVEDAVKLIKDNENSDNFIILDVRTSEEYEEGNLLGAVNLDMSSSGFKNKLNELDKNFKYLIYCKTGARSSDVLEIMYGMGFVEVHNMNGGIMEWMDKGFDVVKFGDNLKK